MYTSSSTYQHHAAFLRRSKRKAKRAAKFCIDNYRFGFNGQEKDNEIKGLGNSINYIERMYDTRLGKPLSIDPLTAKFPMLSPYQFFSDNPIWNIDLDGLEGYQYLEKMKNAEGTTTIKRVVEIDIYVAVSSHAESAHYKSSDVDIIKDNLSREYNRGFKDAEGNKVEFRFNMKEFDVDKITSDDYAASLRRNKDNRIIQKYPSVTAQKAIVMERIKMKGEGDGSLNHVMISNKAKNPSHTQAHEVGHRFLSYEPSMSMGDDVEKHAKAGGVFKYEEVDPSGTTITPTEDVNQTNVTQILKALPEVPEKNK